ncbi:hypothetical protein NDU88_006184 [Pleurodeles waltl]|uniref:Uncharacterized protein n=1 Tax=Pleurodeles waltl TaxID=8319 RepID=A0AAV7NR28_PLEWA|nr:hypothetical protein NDU88_006184 [Pleurodeles waltl]
MNADKCQDVVEEEYSVRHPGGTTQRNSLKEEEWFRGMTLEKCRKGETEAEEVLETQVQSRREREVEEEDAEGGNTGPSEEKVEPQKPLRAERR